MNYSFKSVLAADIGSFLNMKRSLGYKYDAEEYILRRFDAYWGSVNGTSSSVTMESLSGWVKQQRTEGKSFQSSRIHTVKQLMMFRNSLGKVSYVPMDTFPRHPVIHVLSSEEIHALFSEIGAYKPSRPSCGTLRISKEYPVLFRLMLTTGLRRSEAASCLHLHLETDLIDSGIKQCMHKTVQKSQHSIH